MLHTKIEIQDIHAREILDSRGNPTVSTAVTVRGMDGNLYHGEAAVPSGASTGRYEAVELRDGDETRIGGMGCLKAVGNVNGLIAGELKGKDCADQRAIDRLMCEMDGTSNHAKLGANAMLSVSLACAAAAAKAYGLPLWRYLGGIHTRHTFPVPMLNVINGGAHADNSLDIQEYMIVPAGATTFFQAMDNAASVYKSLKKLLKSRGLSTAVGDEGGFAPNFKRDEDAIQAICDAIEASGLKPGKDVFIALDAASSEWAENDALYHLPKAKRTYAPQQLLRRFRYLMSLYPILSIEDGAGEDDEALWKTLTERLGRTTMLVGDDLFVTNAERIQHGIANGLANAVLIKPNQAGTLTETLEAIALAQRNGYRVVVSHRSGETADTFIADLAAAVSADFIKSGAPCRAERTAKYNRLSQIFAD
ncbi:MAG: phosphopyruvate hydratase [Eubacteriales bacterium]|nr:phosphopyruvate hydratase [Eubacteriales bacterium]MDY5347569.1 phosphopyruvate hydratase [Eubacteriales bacterium]